MTLTRKSLKAMGIEDEKIDQIIEDHSETVEALKKQRDNYKSDAEKVEELERKIKELESVNVDDYREKYEAEHQAFEDYKAEIEAGKKAETLKNLYRDLLKDAGIDEKRIDTVLRVSDLSGLELNKDGSLKNRDALKDGIIEEWPDFIATTESKGASVDNPPNHTGGKKTKDEILSIKDTTERQAAIADSIANGDGYF